MMQETEFMTCMKAIAESREMIQVIKSELDPYICMKEENLKNLTNMIITAVISAVSAIFATIDKTGVAQITDGTIDIEKIVGDSINLDMLGYKGDGKTVILDNEYGSTEGDGNVDIGEIEGLDADLLDPSLLGEE